MPLRSRSELQDLLNHAVQQDLSFNNLMPASGITVHQWNAAYRDAFTLYGAGLYVQALPILAELLGHMPMVAVCHFMVGACLHRLGRFRDAVQAYMTAYALDVDDPLPLFHCGDCLKQLGKPTEALMSLTRFVELADSAKHAQHIAQARFILRALTP